MRYINLHFTYLLTYLLTYYVRHIVTDRVAWSVGLSQ